MKVLLIYPSRVDFPIDISTGLASISAFLKNKNHQVTLLDCLFGFSNASIKNKILTFNPQIIGIPVASNDFNFSVKLCTYIKSFMNVPIVCGGYHTTLSPEDILSESCFDFAVIGEGEFAFNEIINTIEKKEYNFNIPGVWYKKDNIIIKNKLRPLFQDIDLLPIPDKSLFDYKKYLLHNRGIATFISSFGCPFPCSYCINASLVKMFGHKNFVRYKSIDYLLNEIKSVTSKYKIREIEFYDETFTVNKQRVQEFCLKFPKEINIPFNINARVDTIDPTLLELLKNAGCRRISMGIETGDVEVRNSILKRNVSDSQIIDAFHMAHEKGLQTHSYNMVGIPFETKESIHNTIEINRKCKPDFIAVSIFNAYKGTEIYTLCEKKGWLTEDKGQLYFQTSNIKHPNFSLPELIKIRNSFGYEVFKTYNKKRAFIELMDKNLTKHRAYIVLRSLLIRYGIKRFL